MLMNIIDKYKYKKWAYFFSYSLGFVFLCAIIFFRFVLYHKTIIWYQDGLKQHYNAILYYGKYLREIISTLIHEHRFSLPMWDFSIGMGSDVITTLHYYAIGDPLAFLSVLVPERFCQYFYFLLYLLRLYLAGLSFSAFSFYHRNSRFSTLIGSFIYIFSAYSLVLGLMHPFFVAPLVWFPMILLGIDKIFDGKNPATFIIFTSIAAMSNFYFFYMEIALAILYAIYRYFSKNRKFNPKTFITIIGKFALYGLNSFLISAVILLPVLAVMFSSARFQASKDNELSLFYKADYYLKFIADFTNMQIAGSWTLMGYTSVGLFAVVLMFLRRKKFKGLLIVFTLLTVFALLPSAAFALNGFAYVVNRWMFAYAMCVGYVAAALIPEIKKIDEKEKRKAVLILLSICLISVLFAASRSEQTFASAAMIVFLALSLYLFESKRKNESYIRGFIVVMLTVGFAANSYYKMSINSSEWLDQFLDSHIADKQLKEINSDELLTELSDGGFYRIAESGLDSTQNSSIQRKVRTSGFYFSLTNPYISKFINDMYFNVPKDYDYSGMEGRSILESLASVKYYMAREEDEDSLPFGYDEMIAEGETAQGLVGLYKSDYAMPLGYTYDKYVSSEDFENMSVTQRAEAMLEGAVTDESTLKKAEVSDTAVDVLDSVETKGSIEAADDHFYVRKNGSVRLKLKKAENSETYVIFKNLRFKGIPEREAYDDGQWAGLTEFEKAHVRQEDSYGHTPNTSSMQISAGDVSRILEIYSPGADFYCGRRDFLVNLGYSEESPDEISISFRNPGYYTFDSLEVKSMNTEEAGERLSDLKKDRLKNIVFSTNRISGEIELDAEKMLVFSIPYSEGWKLYIDGEERSLKNVNIMYMGAEIESGKHEVLLTYETPFLRKGAIMTVLGIIMFFAIQLCDIIRKKFYTEKVGV